MSNLKSLRVKDLKKQIELRDFQSYNKAVQLMKSPSSEVRDEEKKEAAYVVFLKSYYDGNMFEGKRAMEYLLQFVKEEEWKDWYTTLMVNAAFYMSPISSTLIHNLKQKNFRNLSSLNPFLFRDPVTNDYIAGIRCMNLTSNKGSDYDIFIYDEDGFLKGNFPMEYDFHYKKYKRINTTHGVEDVRIISFRDKFIGVGTTMDTHAEGTIRMSLFYLEPKRIQHENDKNKTITRLTAQALLPLKGYDDDQRQKNWLPFVHENQLHFIYKSDPITILKAKEEGGMLTGLVEKIYVDKCFMAPKQRGNTPPIPYEGKWLYITHFNEPKHRIYYHRFIEMDKDFKMTRVSTMFYFERNKSIEFAVNMIPDNDGFLISYGVEDKYARISYVNKKTIEEMFQLRNELVSLL